MRVTSSPHHHDHVEELIGLGIMTRHSLRHALPPSDRTRRLQVLEPWLSFHVSCSPFCRSHTIERYSTEPLLFLGKERFSLVSPHRRYSTKLHSSLLRRLVPVSNELVRTSSVGMPLEARSDTPPSNALGSCLLLLCYFPY
jgi:hypothetical protein